MGRNEIKPFKGVKFVSYHEHWPYFAERFGLDYFGTIELKPGIDPTPRHIEELSRQMKSNMSLSSCASRSSLKKCQNTLLNRPVRPW